MRRLLSPVAQFALSGLLVVLAVAVVGVLAVRHISRNEALRDAKQVTELAGNAVVAPAIEPGVLDENPAALAKLNRVVRFYVLRDPVVRVKLWDESGRIVYSDEPRLIGKRFELEPDERELFRRPGVRADVSDLSRPENRFEKGRGPLREVYLGIRGPRGERLLFETYLREGAISAESRRVWRDVIPVVLGVLLALWLVQIPLGWRLSRRLQRAQHQAVTASEHERRRLARDLHDGLAQDLLYIVVQARGLVERHPNAESPRGLLYASERALDESRGAIGTLTCPPDAPLARVLGSSVREIAHRAGAKASVRVDGKLEPSARVREAVLRIAREATCNAARHGRASHVLVTLHAGDPVRLTVTDDGVGFDAEAALRDGRGFGLESMRERAHTVGGTLSIGSRPGQGTEINAILPRQETALSATLPHQRSQLTHAD